jgi:hypothetical protein
MKTGLEYLEQELDLEEIKRWLYNYVNSYSEFDLLTTRFGSFWDFIFISFPWQHTPEGYEYWSQIAQRKSSFEPKQKIKKFKL